jgi:hypothetical protein
MQASEHCPSSLAQPTNSSPSYRQSPKRLRATQSLAAGINTSVLEPPEVQEQDPSLAQLAPVTSAGSARAAPRAVAAAWACAAQVLGTQFEAEPLTPGAPVVLGVIAVGSDGKGVVTPGAV